VGGASALTVPAMEGGEGAGFAAGGGCGCVDPTLVVTAGVVMVAGVAVVVIGALEVEGQKGPSDRQWKRGWVGLC
jgi:hypothetical protein